MVNVWTNITTSKKKGTGSPTPATPGVVKILPQVGKAKSLLRDAGRKALLPGKRISKTGNVYWETRGNRSDAAGKKV